LVHGVRALCTKYNVLMIADEVRFILFPVILILFFDFWLSNENLVTNRFKPVCAAPDGCLPATGRM
jgi:hypothetical protein